MQITVWFGGKTGVYGVINSLCQILLDDLLDKVLRYRLLCLIFLHCYILFILRIDMGDKIPMIYLSGILGSVLGVSLGFFIGSATSASESAKMGMTMGISMTSCFLSGLMVGNMKAVIEENCPIINVINPASIISDLFYCLSIYDDYSRYIERAVLLLIMSVVFAAGGFLMTRRKKYASI